MLDGLVENLLVIFLWDEVEMISKQFDRASVGEIVETDGPVRSPHQTLRAEAAVESFDLLGCIWIWVCLL